MKYITTNVKKETENRYKLIIKEYKSMFHDYLKWKDNCGETYEN